MWFTKGKNNFCLYKEVQQTPVFITEGRREGRKTKVQIELSGDGHIRQRFDDGGDVY